MLNVKCDLTQVEARPRSVAMFVKFFGGPCKEMASGDPLAIFLCKRASSSDLYLCLLCIYPHGDMDDPLAIFFLSCICIQGVPEKNVF